MTTRPGYLEAMARVGQWRLPPSRPDAGHEHEHAHPRPRARFEPDARPDDDDWGEQVIETSADPAVGPPARPAVPPTAAAPATPPALASELVEQPPPTAEEPRFRALAATPRPDDEQPAAARPATPTPPAPRGPPSTAGGELDREPVPPDRPAAAEVLPGPTTRAVPSPPPSAAPTPEPGPAPGESADEARPVPTPEPARIVAPEEHRARPLDPPVPAAAASEEPASESDDPGPTVTVQIDRIEVRLAADPVAPPPPAPRVPLPGPSLDDYLQRQTADRGRLA